MSQISDFLSFRGSGKNYEAFRTSWISMQWIKPKTRTNSAVGYKCLFLLLDITA